jgi:hypothetical protein
MFETYAFSGFLLKLARRNKHFSFLWAYITYRLKHLLSQNIFMTINLPFRHLTRGTNSHRPLSSPSPDSTFFGCHWSTPALLIVAKLPRGYFSTFWNHVLIVRRWWKQPTPGFNTTNESGPAASFCSLHSPFQTRHNCGAGNRVGNSWTAQWAVLFSYLLCSVFCCIQFPIIVD